MITIAVSYGGSRRFTFKAAVVPRAGDFVLRADTDERWYVEHVTWHVSRDGGPVANVVLQARLA